MKCYRSYVDTDLPHLPKMPDHWQLKRVKHVARFTTGWTPPTGNTASYIGENLWATIGDLGPRVLKDTANQISDEAARKSGIPLSPEGSLLFSFKLSVGTVSIAGAPMFTNEAIATFLPQEDYETRWAFYAFPVFIPENSAINIYGARLLNQQRINDAFLPLPPMKEQVAIANYLDLETARIDQLIEEKQGVMDVLLRAITSLATRFLDIPEEHWVRIQNVVDVVQRPVLQEKDCSYTKLGLFNRGRGIFKKYESAQEDMGDSDFFWVESGDLIISGQFAWEGAIAIATAEHSGCVVSHRFPVIRGRSGLVLTEYLFALLASKHGSFILNDCSRGAAGRNKPLNQNLLMKWKIPIPPIEEQREIAQLVELREKIRFVTGRSIELLKELRASTIADAVQGRIEVRPAIEH